MKKILSYVVDVLLVIPAMVILIVMVVCGLFDNVEEFDPYL